jgi:hypothetical protein
MFRVFEPIQNTLGMRTPVALTADEIVAILESAYPKAQVA